MDKTLSKLQHFINIHGIRQFINTLQEKFVLTYKTPSICIAIITLLYIHIALKGCFKISIGFLKLSNSIVKISGYT